MKNLCVQLILSQYAPELFLVYSSLNGLENQDVINFILIWDSIIYNYFILSVLNSPYFVFF